MTDSDTTARSIVIWIREGTWRATVDAALSLALSPARFTLLHVTSPAAADAAHGAYLGLLGRGGHDPGERLEALASASVADLIEAAARRLGRECERREIHDDTERAVVAASAHADLLIVARDGERSRLGPKSLGRATRFVVDHAACQVLLLAGGRAGCRHDSSAAGTPAPPRPVSRFQPCVNLTLTDGRSSTYS